MNILKQGEKLLTKSNVIGFKKEPVFKIKDGRITGEKCLRVYVSRKMPEAELEKSDIVPKKIGLIKKIETDIIEIGDVKALQVDKTAFFQTVPLGVSVGHINITAGSLGMLYHDSAGISYAGSNAHVLTEDPSKNSRDIIETRICQPGPYHDSSKQLVGEYYWHEQILPPEIPSNCGTSNTIAKSLNLIWGAFGRATRFKTMATGYNTQDFAVYRPTRLHSNEIADGSFDKNLPFIGHLFAGSEQIGIICKVKYALAKGFTPIVSTAEVQIDDEVCGCSFWCNYRTTVMDDSAVVQVGYGNFNAIFEDVIFVRNENVIKGGWSGSGWRLLNRV